MTTSLTVSDFKTAMAVCEVRYENAYLIYDRTGLICDDLRRMFSNLSVVIASPNQTTLQADEGSCALELSQCRFGSQAPDNQLQSFASHSKRFFDSVLYNLDIRTLSRVGLRVFFRRDYKSIDELKAALASLKLITLAPAERFGAASEPYEILLRWQGAHIGTMFRVAMQSGTIDVHLPPELQPEKPDIHKSISALMLDIDYYTVTPVERSQWDPSTWITHSFKTMKKGADSIFGN